MNVMLMKFLSEVVAIVLVLVAVVVIAAIRHGRKDD
jgi:hypothetical protein